MLVIETMFRDDWPGDASVAASSKRPFSAVTSLAGSTAGRVFDVKMDF